MRRLAGPVAWALAVPYLLLFFASANQLARQSTERLRDRL
jgi:hypothetical protein